MIRSIPDYTILEFGYEKILPSLAQMHTEITKKSKVSTHSF